MSKNKPYNEEKDEFGVIRRTFYETTDSDEFVWHRDHEDRVVIPLAENNWMLQFDNELPIKLNVNEEYFIPKNTFHRVIKGSGDLMVEIIETTFEPDEYEILGEGKKKSGGKKDACYYKVKSRYKVWPSAYASGALVKCRKVGAKNWGNKTKEGIKSRLKTLNEISSNDAYSKFYANLFDRENPDNDRLIYNKIIQLDPTFKPQADKLGMYTKWLFRKDNIESLKNTKDEDLYKIKSDLEFFHNAKTKNLLPPESKDINKFNIKTLLDLVFDMQKSGEDLMSKTEKEKEIKSEVDKYELDDWTVIVPKTEEASCYYGKGTRWCTAADNNNMFDTYSYDGPLYILIGKHDKSDKYQFHFESSQFMDAKDNPINLSEFMNDNSDVYEFFNGRVGGNLDFEIAKSSLENYDEYGFQDFYSDDFTDEQKAELVRLAFDRDEQSESFYNVSNVLNYVDYPNMKSDFRDAFIWGLEVSLGNSYDEENYDARMFIDYLGGFNSENISTIVKATDLKDVDQINKLFEIASEYNGEKLLSDYLENEDVNINFDMIKTIGDIKDKFNYSDWRKTVESDLVKIRFNSFDLENGTINITIVPKDENKEPISDKAESGNIKYQNLIKYLTNRQLFNEAKKKRKLTAKPSSEKNLGDWFARKGGKGKSKGWVDCNTCRKDKKTGRNKCKPCGRKEGEKRAKYPACRPTPSACKTKGKGKRWGKKSVNENVDKQTINKFLFDFGMLATLNLAKVQSYAKTDEAKNKLAEMQRTLNTFTSKYFDETDPTKNTELYDPKVLSQIIGEVGKHINYIKPRIEQFVKDSDIKKAWLAKIQDLSDRYLTIIGKPNENRVHLIKNMLNENSEMLDVVEVFTIYNSDVHTVEPDVKPAEVPTKPVEKKPKTDSPYVPSIRPKTKPKAIK
jgi:hypothetical protein